MSPLLPQQVREKTVGITPADLRAYYLKALAHPSFVDQLTEYEVAGLSAYADGVYQDACELASNLLEGSADYPYPLGLFGTHQMQQKSGEAKQKRPLMLF